MSITQTALMQQRRDTAANWTSANPTLLAGEIGIESDTSKIKLGTGSTSWTSLSYTTWSQITAYPFVNADIASAAAIAYSKLATLTSGNIVLGSSANVATSTAVSGDITISNTGVAAIATGVIVNADINASAAIVDTKLATIATALKVSNSATTATDANTASAIVARNASGNFTAGTITAALTGTASNNLPLAGGTLTGDVILDNQVDARFREATANGTNYVGFQAPATIAADVLWTLPASDGASAQVLSTNGSGTLSWATAAGGSSIIVESQQVIGADYTLTAGYNGMSAGPVEVTATFAVTVPANATWVIL